MSKVDANAADLFLESTVLSERDTVRFPLSSTLERRELMFDSAGQDSRLHADLVKRYLDRLEELLSEPEAKAHVRQQGPSLLLHLIFLRMLMTSFLQKPTTSPLPLPPPLPPLSFSSSLPATTPLLPVPFSTAYD